MGILRYKVSNINIKLNKFVYIILYHISNFSWINYTMSHQKINDNHPSANYDKLKHNWQDQERGMSWDRVGKIIYNGVDSSW